MKRREQKELKSLGFDTRAIHAGQEADPTTGASAVPIYQTSSFEFKSTSHAAALFDMEEEGNIYTRIMNPTNEVLEERITALEGGVGAVAAASGLAAEVMALLTIAREGDEIVSGSSIYGGTFSLFKHTFKRFGITVKFAESEDPASFKQQINHNTRALYVETIGNPELSVPDLEELAGIAHDAGLPLVVDNTFATPYHCRPFEYGADIVVHSTTKFIGGHGNSIGGMIVDSGQFDWANGKFPEMTEPDPAYHGIRYTEHFGEKAFISKARGQMLRDLGSCLSPFNAFLLLQGAETLSLRMERHSENALQVARYLEDDPRVSWVNYPGLEGHHTYENACKYLHHGCSGILTFGVKGGKRAGSSFIDNLSIFTHLANIGDARSLAIHPASTTHQQLSEEEQKNSGVSPDLIRLSIGLESIEDLIADLDQALEAAAAGGVA